jgi:AcrR family transcriptional regulator
MPPTDPDPTPKRRRLDHEQVVAAAERIVDEQGWDRLTMAALAAEVGTKVPSLYNHVTSLEALRGELQARTMRLLGEELVTSALGRVGRDSFRSLAFAFREFVHRYPNRYEGATRTPVDPDGMAEAADRANAALAAVVRSYGVEPDLELQVEITVFAALHGAVSLEIAGFYGDVVDSDAVYEGIVDAAERRLAMLGDERAA